MVRAGGAALALPIARVSERFSAAGAPVPGVASESPSQAFKPPLTRILRVEYWRHLRSRANLPLEW